MHGIASVGETMLSRELCLLGELSLGLGGVHSVAGDRGQLLTAIILVVDVVGHIFQVLHVGPMEAGDTDQKESEGDSMNEPMWPFKEVCQPLVVKQTLCRISPDQHVA